MPMFEPEWLLEWPLVAATSLGAEDSVVLTYTVDTAPSVPVVMLVCVSVDFAVFDGLDFCDGSVKTETVVRDDAPFGETELEAPCDELAGVPSRRLSVEHKIFK